MGQDISINTTPARAFYPMFGGPTGGNIAAPSQGGSDTPVAPVNASSSGETAQAASIGALGNPLTWWITLAFLLLALMFVAKRFGSEQSDFANVKLSVYNILVITLAAVIGITFGKMVFTRWKVPGLSTVMLAV